MTSSKSSSMKTAPEPLDGGYETAGIFARDGTCSSKHDDVPFSNDDLAEWPDR